MSAYRLVTPSPQIERSCAIFHILRKALTKNVEVRIFVYRQIVIKAYALVDEILSAMHFAVYECAVHIVIDTELPLSADAVFLP